MGKRTVEMNEIDMRVFHFIRAYKILNGGNSPSFAEIGEGTGIKSNGHLTFLLDKLEVHGYIERKKNAPRWIRIPGDEYIIN